MTERELLELADKMESHENALIYANSRSEAVEWMATAANLLRKAARGLKDSAKLVSDSGRRA